MIRRGLIIAAALIGMLTGCDKDKGPDFQGEIELSSQLYGSESYYLLGYSYENSEYYRFPAAADPIPDIINEGYLVDGSKQYSVPGFNTPNQGKGFALVGEFGSGAEADAFFYAYGMVEDGLSYQALSDTVKLHQVWVQQTVRGNYVKMLITDIRSIRSGIGKTLQRSEPGVCIFG